jgi:hypothetical protein
MEINALTPHSVSIPSHLMVSLDAGICKLSLLGLGLEFLISHFVFFPDKISDICKTLYI